MKKTKRITLWTVDYAVWGAHRTSRAYFRRYEDAKEFAKEDYRDNPVKRTYTEEHAREIMALHDVK